MRYRHCHFSRGLGENIWQKKHILERHQNFLCCPRRFLLIDWLNSRFKIVHSSSFNVFFKIAERPFEGRREKVKLVCSPPNKFCFSREIYWSIVEAILKHFWRMWNVILKKSPISIISLLCFQLHFGENCKYNSSSKNHLKSKKTVEFLN